MNFSACQFSTAHISFLKNDHCCWLLRHSLRNSYMCLTIVHLSCLSVVSWLRLTLLTTLNQLCPSPLRRRSLVRLKRFRHITYHQPVRFRLYFKYVTPSGEATLVVILYVFWGRSLVTQNNRCLCVVISVSYYVVGTLSSPAARGGNLAKIPPNQVIGDFGRGNSEESEYEWCPAGIIELLSYSRWRPRWRRCTKTCVFSHVYVRFSIVVHVFGCFKSQQIHLEMFQSNQSPFRASKDRY